MTELSDFLSKVRMQSREFFMKAHPHPFLLQKLPSEHPSQPAAGADPDGDWAGQTRLTRLSSKAGSFAVLRNNGEMYRVFALVAKEMPPSPEPGQDPAPFEVRVGRAADNDIVLAQNDISKYHASFMCNELRDWFLRDANSRNGSSVNGRRVENNIPVPVAFGDPIVMGGLGFIVIGAGALYELVAAQLSSPSTG